MSFHEHSSIGRKMKNGKWLGSSKLQTKSQSTNELMPISQPAYRTDESYDREPRPAVILLVSHPVSDGCLGFCRQLRRFPSFTER